MLVSETKWQLYGMNEIYLMRQLFLIFFFDSSCSKAFCFECNLVI
jgi:hypothetical protein